MSGIYLHDRTRKNQLKSVSCEDECVVPSLPAEYMLRWYTSRQVAARARDRARIGIAQPRVFYPWPGELADCPANYVDCVKAGKERPNFRAERGLSVCATSMGWVASLSLDVGNVQFRRFRTDREMCWCTWKHGEANYHPTSLQINNITILYKPDFESCGSDTVVAML